MDVFKNFIFIFMLTGALTRGAIYLLGRYLDKRHCAMLAFGLIGLIIIPLVSIYIGFDVAISEYLLAMIIWLVVDLMHYPKENQK